MAGSAGPGERMTPRNRDLFEQFGISLAQVFESMADERPSVTCEAPSQLPEGEEILWWEQPLQFAPEMRIWAGALRSTWEYAGTITLKAAGLDSVEESEARNTWLEILGQALSVLARAVGGVLGREVACEGGVEHAPENGIEEWAALRIRFGDTALAPLYLSFSPQLSEAIAEPPTILQPPQTAVEEDEDASTSRASIPARSRTMSLLLDVDLPVSISFGKTHLAMRDVIKLTTGSIVELNRGVNEPVEVLVNGSLVARGEVVVVEGNYGVRILEIASRQDRMRTLR
jgi:flagellar motor switch protein FliN